MSDMKFAPATALALILIASGCGGDSGRHLTGIQVYPVTPNVSAGTQVTFSITGFYSDRTLQTIPNSQGSWSSSNTSIASIDANGIATSVGPEGFTTITVTASQQTSTTVLSVGPGPILSVIFSGGGAGDITSSPPGLACESPAACFANFTIGSTITLTATPGNGSTFGGWAGCDTSAGTGCTINELATNRVVTVTFN